MKQTILLAILSLLFSIGVMAQSATEKGFDAYNKGEYNEAFLWFTKGAENDDNADAMRFLGMMYENGRGVAQSYPKAIEWYEKAVEKGDTDAMYELGYLYENGLGVTKSQTKAIEWYQKAAEKGNTEAIKRLKKLR